MPTIAPISDHADDKQHGEYRFDPHNDEPRGAVHPLGHGEKVTRPFEVIGIKAAVKEQAEPTRAEEQLYRRRRSHSDTAPVRKHMDDQKDLSEQKEHPDHGKGNASAAEYHLR